MDNNPNSHKDNTETGGVEPIFPPELIYDILLRLPVESLSRFKCVSKSFGAIIDSPEFAKMQLHKSSKKKLILKELVPRKQKRKTTGFYVCDIDGGLERKAVFRNQQGTRLSLCSSVNGLILLSNEYSNYVLWNPSSNRYRDLPPCPLERTPRDGGFDKCRMGLGHDSVSDDYKVVLIHRGNTWIFGLKSNSWARIDHVFSPYAERGLSFSASFAHGNLHWLYNSQTEASQTIVAFDVTKETVSEVSCPLPSYYMTGLHVLDGCLCVSYFSRTKEEGALLYVRKKDGDDYAWCKLYSVTSQLQLFFPIVCLKHVTVVGYSKGGNKILLDVGLRCMISYDLKEKTFNESDIPAECTLDRMPAMCCESLVPIGLEATTCSTDRRRGCWEDTL